MYAGRIVEEGSARQVVLNPHHPYTIGLLRSRADGALAKGSRLQTIPGSPPDLANRQPGLPLRTALLPCRGTLPRGRPAGGRGRTGPSRRLLEDRRGGAELPGSAGGVGVRVALPPTTSP